MKTVQADVAKERARLETEGSAAAAELDKTTAERAALAASISAPALALFEHVAKHRKGLAMSEARDGHCMQCHVRLRPQVYNDIRRNERLIQCESCSRILYYIAPPASAAASPSA